MNSNSKIEELKLFAQEYLKEYKKNFTKITKKEAKFASIKSDYLDWDKYSDHYGLQMYYKDYNFLNHLSRIEKDKAIFVYSIERYIASIKEMEDMQLHKEYLLDLQFSFYEEFFADSELTLFPYVSYKIADTNDWKLHQFTWHKEVEFWKYWEEWRTYMKQIIEELKLEKYFDFIDYYFVGDYQVTLDFNFYISEHKKQYKDFINS